MVGREVVLRVDKKERSPGAETLSVEELVVHDHRGLAALRGVSFTVREGEILGVAGVDGNGQIVAQNDSAPAAGTRPASSWSVGELIADRRGLLLPGDLPPGEYGLRVGIYLPASGERLPVVDGDGNKAGDSLPLGHLAVTAP
jgi:hypothetical protein